jgi:transposase-like protein
MLQGRGRAFWERLAREVDAGASQGVVAKRHHVSKGWLGKWCRRLRDEGGDSTTLLPVRVLDDRVRRIDLAVGAVRLSFEEGTSPHYVAELARVLAK